MAKYKLKSGSHTMGGIRYKAGVKDNDILDLTNEQAKQFEEGRLIPLDSGGDSGDDRHVKLESGEKTGVAVDLSSNLVNTDDIKYILSELPNIKELDQLEIMYNEEEKHRNRQQVLDAINKQYESLGSQDNKETNVANVDAVITAKKGKK